MDRIREVLNFPSIQRPLSNGPLNFPGHFPEAEIRETTAQLPYFNLLFVRPVTILVYLVLLLFFQVTQVLYFLGNSDSRSSLSAGTTASNALINDPISRAEHFVRELEENLLPLQQFTLYHSDRNSQYLPPFFQGSYTQALYMASTRAKFFYVYLTNLMSDGSQSLFAKVITNPKFRSIFQNEHVIIWGGDVTDPEAYQLANSLNITKFPMIGLLCLTRTTSMTPDGPRKSSPRISLILKIQGGLKDSTNPESLIHNKFVKRMAKYDGDLVIIRAELREKYLTEAMRHRQDADFQRSLLIDKQKKERKRLKKLSEKYLKWKQPYFKHLQESTEARGTLRIAIKFETGQRVTVMFPKNSPVEDIFLFVELHNRKMLDDMYETTMSDADAQALFRGFDMKFEFRLTSSIPPRPTLNDIHMQTPIEDVNFIFPSGLLMVERT
ncbi:hypothetical protein METBIDRAFT_76422 [Metschnikowia bicuspidata var. bicuspidata NRRL YB-4993]|uniref:UBX domain-containing protein n=1 Tax=Metschnikowia bicuspidata var. bicuspidata NRRL YB-4993 TaxID=869754 RepID=A0A1A0HH90_9ASCO|nr:hypothetical protein METBIDRAFT_76422 [Metschnikowia bicuspidata var. bicuspidata NRRL YB-4993]OBA23366.1 hypothetical protein METBIDRAFT_76422 [Metschnikowia bicuspidata var. bicuspidata NRRL YB-4993]